MSRKSHNSITVSSLKDQEDKNVDPPMKKGEGNPSRSVDPSIHIQVAVSVGKRKADGDGLMPTKKMRLSNPIDSAQPVQVAVEEKKEASVDNKLAQKTSVITTGKRKASDDGEAPSKRARSGATEPQTSPEAEKEASREQLLLSCLSYLTRDDFEEKYQELEPIGQGGFGSVCAGLRKSDGLPVAIKHVPARIVRRLKVNDNSTTSVPLEVALMITTTGHSQSVGQHAEVTLLNWYDLEEELILVMERPENAMDLLAYREARGGHLKEDEAMMILKQLVDAAIHMESKGVFHRDIKLQNVLIHAGDNGPRARVIDFGCGVFESPSPLEIFSGTLAYAPPEWFLEKKYWAKTSTVWQLGVLFYMLLAGQRHFHTMYFMQSKIRINLKLSPEVKILLAQCLAIRPKRRPTLEQLQRTLALLTTRAPATQGLP